jgi:dTDP-4-dehydrorhamnose 3,5-epimerase
VERVRVTSTEIPEVLIIEPEVFHDDRGFFLETYHAERYARSGLATRFEQDNHSKSIQGTIRGLHLQVGRPQGKLVRAIAGAVYDVAVDVRRGSPTFGRWVAVTLSAENFKQCFIPSGFAHGFAVLTPTAEIEYKCTDVYDPASEIGIAWNDPTLAIPWPVSTPILSQRDHNHPLLDDQLDRLPVYTPERTAAFAGIEQARESTP